MKQLSLSGSSRENVGKKDAAALRKKGKVPAVIYGGDKQIHFFVEANVANKLVYTPEVYSLEIEVEGTTYKAILQDVQIHPVTDAVLHIDFMEVLDGKPIKVRIPVTTSGQARGVLNGGSFAMLYRKLHVVGLESDLPDAINIDITNLRIGEKIRIGDLKSEGITFLDAESSVIVAVRAARGAVEEDEDGEGEDGASEGDAGENQDASAEG
jgi:large subunit ribosomal protein L25